MKENCLGKTPEQRLFIVGRLAEQIMSCALERWEKFTLGRLSLIKGD